MRVVGHYYRTTHESLRLANNEEKRYFLGQNGVRDTRHKATGYEAQ